MKETLWNINNNFHCNTSVCFCNSTKSYRYKYQSERGYGGKRIISICHFTIILGGKFRQGQSKNIIQIKKANNATHHGSPWRASPLGCQRISTQLSSRRRNARTTSTDNHGKTRILENHWRKWFFKLLCSHVESNHDQTLRKGSSYPLNDGSDN